MDKIPQAMLDSTVSENVVAIPVNVPTMIVAANPRRVALIIGTNAGGTYIGTQPGMLRLGGGFVSFNQLLPIVLSRLLHGELVAGAWFALNAATTDTVSVIEVLSQAE